MDDQGLGSPEAKELLRMLSEIRGKVMHAGALNGGFDRLSQKIDKLESTVGEIHDAIYDPDEGLYARVRTATNEHDSDVTNITQKITTIEEWIKEDEKSREETDDNLLALEKEIKGVQSITKAIRWVGTAVVGAIIIATTKSFVVFLSQHIALK